MNDIQRFFAWFEGFVENIPGEPTREQWDKVVNRINALKDVDLAAAAMTPASAATPKPQQPMIKPTNATQWKAQYQGILSEKYGIDDEAARDFANEISVDLNRMPADAALETAKMFDMADA